MMHPSLSQILISLERLANLHPFFGYAFFAFKKADIPVGKTSQFSSAFIRNKILRPYFRPLPDYAGYFNPFKSNTRWLRPRYESTSLQRIVADTFASAFIHEKGSSRWGWAPDYVHQLSSLMLETQSSRIPLLDLAIWLYRRDTLPADADDAVGSLIARLIEEFHLQQDELAALFSTQSARSIDLAPTPVEDKDVINVVGWPDGTREQEGVVLQRLSLSQVGPADRLDYYPKPRMNVVTGDNSLGKTFLLDCIWWALSGHWSRLPAEPSQRKSSAAPEISYAMTPNGGPPWAATAPYNRLKETWQRPEDAFESLGLYATHTGAVALWDPMQSSPHIGSSTRGSNHTILSREEVWDGLRYRNEENRTVQICNGLITDWVTWELQRKKHGKVLRAFEGCLKELSPPDGPSLRAGPIATVPGDARPFPTIRMPYGAVPVSYASAGVQRILGLAYMLVWHWTQHVRRAELLSREPLKKMVIIVDEIEAHLHPRWQRQIVPALIRTLRTLSKDIDFQLHVATHSPLVLTSLEPVFDLDLDQIHHLSLRGAVVEIHEVTFAKQGTADSWLESGVFGLRSSRSAEAEIAIERAKRIQLNDNIEAEEVRELNDTLRRVLPDDDPFWVRWNFFFERTTGDIS